MTNYLIIGNSAAAIGAVEGIRRSDWKNPITLIAEEPYPCYSRPLISYYLEGRVAENEMGYRGADFYAANRVEARLGVRARRVDPDRQEVILESGEVLPYDRLLIATGSRPATPPIGGMEKKGVFFFNKLDDARALRQYVSPGSRCAVIGGGLTGLKAAEALIHLGARVLVADISSCLLSAILDPAGAEIVKRHLAESGIGFKLGVPVVELAGDSQVEGLIFADGCSQAVDAVIVATGVRPNLEVVSDTGVDVGQGIIVDNHLQTNLPGIFAAGDVSEGWDIVRQQRRVIANLPNAYKQGETAGRNMAGEKVVYPGGLALNSVSLFGLAIATAGISNSEDSGVEAVQYLKEAEKIYRRLNFRDGRLVGYICIGDIGRAGILTALIKSRAPLADDREGLLKGDFGLVDLPEEVRLSWRWERGDLTWRF